MNSLTIWAWFSHSFSVKGPAGTFNSWTYLVASEDPSDNLVSAIVDPNGGVYAKSYEEGSSCQGETNYITGENSNRLVVKCDNW